MALSVPVHCPPDQYIVFLPIECRHKPSTCGSPDSNLTEVSKAVHKESYLLSDESPGLPLLTQAPVMIARRRSFCFPVLEW